MAPVINTVVSSGMRIDTAWRSLATMDASWREEDDHLVRELSFADFAGAMAFVNRVADAAEAVDHHPDIFVHGWNKVTLTLQTHTAGAVTDADHALAETIDGLTGSG